MTPCFEKEPRTRILGRGFGTVYVRTLTPESDPVLVHEVRESANWYGKTAQLSEDGQHIIIHAVGVSSKIELERVPVGEVRNNPLLNRKIAVAV